MSIKINVGGNFEHSSIDLCIDNEKVKCWLKSSHWYWHRDKQLAVGVYIYIEMDFQYRSGDVMKCKHRKRGEYGKGWKKGEIPNGENEKTYNFIFSSLSAFQFPQPSAWIHAWFCN